VPVQVKVAVDSEVALHSPERTGDLPESALFLSRSRTATELRLVRLRFEEEPLVVASRDRIPLLLLSRHRPELPPLFVHLPMFLTKQELDTAQFAVTGGCTRELQPRQWRAGPADGGGHPFVEHASRASEVDA
jgi:hypothetical protein